MDLMKKKIMMLEEIAYDPYDRIEHPTAEDWLKSYNALKELCSLKPDKSSYPNTLGYLCYYGRHTGGERQYKEAREWFEKGYRMCNIESTYKLADMLADGLGGPADPKRACSLYSFMYLYCKDEFEGGNRDSKFADTALRMGRVFHEGKLTERDDMEALSFLLEARYAIDRRKEYDYYGDDTVEKNILRLIGECEQPDEEVRNRDQYGVGLGRVPFMLRPNAEIRLSIGIDVNDEGIVRLEFRRNRKDGKKPNRILWPVPPAMRCFMTESIVLYGENVRQIWNRNPGEPVIFDRDEYDEKTDTWMYYLGDELQGKLRGGRYVLPMDEFMWTEMRDHPENGSAISQ